jgi:hypothetical protein
VVYASAVNIITMIIQNINVNIVIQVVYHVKDLSLIIALNAEMKQIQSNYFYLIIVYAI